MAAMTYADVSRGIQRIFKERRESLSVSGLEAAFLERFGVSVHEAAGVTTVEYVLRKGNVFAYDEAEDRVSLQPSVVAGPPIADPQLPKDERFAVDELERLIEDLGPVCCVSALCGKFIQRNGISVSSITKVRPLDLFKRYADRFLVIGGGNVSLPRYRHHPEVLSLVKRGLKTERTSRALQQEDTPQPLPAAASERDVVQEFCRLIEEEGTGTAYISSLCSQFLRRHRRPVTAIIKCRPADLFRKYPEVFELMGGGYVRLRTGHVNLPTEGQDPEPQPTAPTDGISASLGGHAPAGRELLDDKTCRQVLQRIAPPGFCEACLVRVRQLCKLLAERCFLSVVGFVISGTVGQGVAARGTADAEVALLVEGLPEEEPDELLAHLLEALLAVVEMAPGVRACGRRGCGSGAWAELVLEGGPGAEGEALGTLAAAATELPVSLRLLPARGSAGGAEATVDATDVVARQPEAVKEAICLLRWWASQQRWRSPRAVPPGRLLELIAIHAAQQLTVEDGTTPATCARVLERALELCASAPSLRLAGTGTDTAPHGPVDIRPQPPPQAPLVPDPASPHTNIADPAVFDAAELAERSAKGQASRLACFLEVAVDEAFAEVESPAQT